VRRRREDGFEVIERDDPDGLRLEGLDHGEVLRHHRRLAGKIRLRDLEVFQGHQAVDLVYVGARGEEDDAVGFVGGAGGPEGNDEAAIKLVAGPVADLRLIDGKVVAVGGVKARPLQYGRINLLARLELLRLGRLADQDPGEETNEERKKTSNPEHRTSNIEHPIRDGRAAGWAWCPTFHFRC